MQDESLKLKSYDTIALSGGFVHTTEANQPAAGGTLIPVRSFVDGLTNAVETQSMTPEGAIEAHKKHLIETGRSFVMPSVESRLQQYDNDEAERTEFMKYRQPFLFPEFSPNSDFYMSPGMTLIGAKTGNGKTTLLAALLAGFLSYASDTTAVVILNEERGGTLLQRVACVMLQKSFNNFFHGSMHSALEREIRDYARNLSRRIVVVDSHPYNTNCIEDVKTIVTGAPAEGANLIMLDYLQNVNVSRENPQAESWQISKELGYFFKEYGRNQKVPIGVFTQLKTESEGKEFKERVECDKTMINNAFNAIEVKPNKETGLTEFTVWKQRYGYEQQYKVCLKYRAGRYVKDDVPAGGL